MIVWHVILCQRENQVIPRPEASFFCSVSPRTFSWLLCMKVLGTFLISECVRHFEFFHKFRKKEMSLELVNTSSILCGCQCANFDLLCFLILLLGLRVRVGFCCTVEEQIEKQFSLEGIFALFGDTWDGTLASCTCSSLVAKWGLKWLVWWFVDNLKLQLFVLLYQLLADWWLVICSCF
jgi:hypothetical protein